MIASSLSHGKVACFTTPGEAAQAYDAAARAKHGAFARLNFPRPGEQPARQEA